MSQAKPAQQGPPVFSFCVQCTKEIPYKSSRLARHAVPCGHVICGGCFDRLGSEERKEKLGSQQCSSTGCGQRFESLATWPIAMCTQRFGRIVNSRAAGNPQGNVGDIPVPDCDECEADEATGKPHKASFRCDTCNKAYCKTVADFHRKMKSTSSHALTPIKGAPAAAGSGPAGDPAVLKWSLCNEHKEDIRFAEVGTMRLLCPSCLSGSKRHITVMSLDEAAQALQTSSAGLAPEATRWKQELKNLGVSLEEYRDKVDKWTSEEVSRIRLWEKRELQAVRMIADECASMVADVRTQRIDIGSSILPQRLGLSASLEEIEIELKALPAAQAERVAKLIELTEEQKQIVDMLASNKFRLIPTEAFLEWSKLPSLAFDLDGADGNKLHSSVVQKRLRVLLQAKKFSPTYLPFEPEFPVLGKLVRH